MGIDNCNISNNNNEGLLEYNTYYNVPNNSNYESPMIIVEQNAFKKCENIPEEITNKNTREGTNLINDNEINDLDKINDVKDEQEEFNNISNENDNNNIKKEKIFEFKKISRDKFCIIKQGRPKNGINLNLNKIHNGSAHDNASRTIFNS